MNHQIKSLSSGWACRNTPCTSSFTGQQIRIGSRALQLYNLGKPTLRGYMGVCCGTPRALADAILSQCIKQGCLVCEHNSHTCGSSSHEMRRRGHHVEDGSMKLHGASFVGERRRDHHVEDGPMNQHGKTLNRVMRWCTALLYTQLVTPFIRTDQENASQINGAQGEWTGTDDMPGEKKKEKKAKSKEQKKATNAKKKEKRVAKLVKQRDFIVKEKAAGRASEIKFKPIRGRGDYLGDTGRSIGTSLGGWLGEKAGQFIGKIFGVGDYNIPAPGPVQSNSLIAGSSVPAMHVDNAGASEYCFHEFIGNVGMTTNFNLTTYPVNITSNVSFPWISQIATNYQQWELVGCIFFLRSLSSNTVVAPTQGMGSVFGAVRYDVSSTPPSTKSEILNSMFSSSARPSDHQALPIECSRKMTIISPMKVTPQGVTPPDLQFYQMGWLDIATEGAPNDYPDALELHVTYHVRLLKPRIDNGGGASCFSLDIKADVFSVTPVRPIDSTPLVKQPRVNTLGAVVGNDAISVYMPLTMSTGELFLVVWAYTGATSSTNDVAVMGVTGDGGMVLVNGFSDQHGALAGAPFEAKNSGTRTQSISLFTRYDGTGTSLDRPRLLFLLAGVRFPTGTNGGSIIITRVNPALYTGIQSAPANAYSRTQLFRYLCDAVAGRRCTCPPPIIGKLRLVDWVHFFTKTDLWNGVEAPPHSLSPFDIPLVDALATMSKYVSSAEILSEGEEHKRRPEGAKEKEREDFVTIRGGCRPRNSQLGSSHGSYTETDDIDRAESKETTNLPVIVNPPGLTGALSEVHSVFQHRHGAGWKLAQYSMVRTSTKDTWLWLYPAKLLDLRLRKQAPQGVWTIDKIRQVQCFALRGETCNHCVKDCPGMEFTQDRGVAHCAPRNSQIKSSHGSITEGDDLADIPFCGQHPCGKHLHRSRALQAAARRIAERKQEEEKKRVHKPISFSWCPNPTTLNCVDGHVHIEDLSQYPRASYAIVQPRGEPPPAYQPQPSRDIRPPPPISPRRLPNVNRGFFAPQEWRNADDAAFFEEYQEFVPQAPPPPSIEGRRESPLVEDVKEGARVEVAPESDTSEDEQGVEEDGEGDEGDEEEGEEESILRMKMEQIRLIEEAALRVLPPAGAAPWVSRDEVARGMRLRTQAAREKREQEEKEKGLKREEEQVPREDSVPSITGVSRQENSPVQEEHKLPLEPPGAPSKEEEEGYTHFEVELDKDGRPHFEMQGANAVKEVQEDPKFTEQVVQVSGDSEDASDESWGSLSPPPSIIADGQLPTMNERKRFWKLHCQMAEKESPDQIFSELHTKIRLWRATQRIRQREQRRLGHPPRRSRAKIVRVQEPVSCSMGDGATKIEIAKAEVKDESGREVKSLDDYQSDSSEAQPQEEKKQPKSQDSQPDGKYSDVDSGEENELYSRKPIEVEERTPLIRNDSSPREQRIRLVDILQSWFSIPSDTIRRPGCFHHLHVPRQSRLGQLHHSRTPRVVEVEVGGGVPPPPEGEPPPGIIVGNVPHAPGPPPVLPIRGVVNPRFPGGYQPPLHVQPLAVLIGNALAARQNRLHPPHPRAPPRPPFVLDANLRPGIVGEGAFGTFEVLLYVADFNEGYRSWSTRFRRRIFSALTILPGFNKDEDFMSNVPRRDWITERKDYVDANRESFRVGFSGTLERHRAHNPVTRIDLGLTENQLFKRLFSKAYAARVFRTLYDHCLSLADFTGMRGVTADGEPNQNMLNAVPFLVANLPFSNAFLRTHADIYTETLVAIAQQLLVRALRYHITTPNARRTPLNLGSEGSRGLSRK